jgi:hypothetical protein
MKSCSHLDKKYVFIIFKLFKNLIIPLLNK